MTDIKMSLLEVDLTTKESRVVDVTEAVERDAPPLLVAVAHRVDP